MTEIKPPEVLRPPDSISLSLENPKLNINDL